MTRIFGICGKFNGNLLNSMSKSMEYRGDLNEHKFSKGIFISSEDSTIFNNNYCNIVLPNNKDNFYDIGLGVIYSNNENSQPLKYKELILVFDGIIYNINQINSILGNDNDVDYNITEFSAILVLKLLYKFYTEFSDLKTSVEKVTKIINGNYAFSVFDGTNLAISRDSIGINPLYYAVHIDKLNSMNFNSFASEKKALWKIGVKEKDIYSLKPGHILYNWENFPPKSNPWDIDHPDYAKSNLNSITTNNIDNNSN